MKVKGFGKNYFSLAAIEAYSSSVTLHAKTSAFFAFFETKQLCEEECDESPPDELENSPLLENQKPCHCNAYFTHLSKLMVLLNTYIPRCPYYTTYFAFRRTGVHPPLVLIFQFLFIIFFSNETIAKYNGKKAL